MGFHVDVWKFLFSMKACIFVLYCCVRSMTKEFPLSADAIVAPFCMSFVCMDCMVLCSDWLVCLVRVLFWLFNFIT